MNWFQFFEGSSRNLRGRLTIRLFQMVILCTLCFTLLTSACQLWLSYRQDMASIDGTLRSIEQSYIPEIVKSLYNVDEIRLRFQLKKIVHLQDIEYIEIIGQAGNESYRIIEGMPIQPPNVSWVFPLQYSLLNTGEPFHLGTLTVGISYSRVYQPLWRNAIRILISTASQMFLFALVIWLIFQLMLTRHLITMAAYTKTLDIERLDTPLAIQRKEWFSSQPDELDQVVTAINDLRLRLHGDVTKQQQIEDELKQHQRFVERMVETTPNLLYIYDLIEHRNVYANKEVAEFLGYSQEQIQAMGGKLFELIMHPEDMPEILRRHQGLRSATDNDVRELTYRVKHADGQWHWLHSRDVVFSRDSDGQGTQILGVAEDITKHKRAEEQIRALNADLEQRVKQRTAELEAMNNELKSFAYIVSHDLKTPLRGISQLAYWLVQDYGEAFDEQGQKMVDLLINRVKRMDNLIEGILTYSRIGHLKEQRKYLDMTTLLKNVVDSISPPAHIQVRFENELPVIIGDETRITQVFQNLVDNAVKFLDKPQGMINILCEDLGDVWKFCVTDNGPGISEQYHEKIFQIFQTLEARDVRESTGVGLAVVKKIVEFYGGKIWLESTLHQGSSFYVTLPKRGEEENEKL